MCAGRIPRVHVRNISTVSRSEPKTMFLTVSRLHLPIPSTSPQPTQNCMQSRKFSYSKHHPPTDSKLHSKSKECHPAPASSSSEPTITSQVTCTEPALAPHSASDRLRSLALRLNPHCRYHPRSPTVLLVRYCFSSVSKDNRETPVSECF